MPDLRREINYNIGDESLRRHDRFVRAHTRDTRKGLLQTVGAWLSAGRGVDGYAARLVGMLRIARGMPGTFRAVYRAAKTMALEMQGVDTSSRRAADGMGVVEKAGMRVKGALASVFAAGATAGALRFIYKINADAEAARASFTQLLGSAGAADALIRDMVKFAASTPFEMAGLRDNVKFMLAMGFAAETALDDLRKIGDATSALGTGTDGINRIVRALGQMRTLGKLSQEEINQLSEALIPAAAILEERFGRSIEKIKADVASGALGIEEVISAIVDGMGTRYAGGMDRLAETAGGALSTIKDIGTETAREITGGAFQLFAEDLRAIRDALSNANDEANSGALAKWSDRVAFAYRVGREFLGIALQIAPALLKIGGFLVVGKLLAGTFVLVTRAIAAAKIATFAYNAALALTTSRTIAATGAMVGFNAATRANPLGLLIGLLAAAATAVAVLRAKTDEHTDALARENNQLREKLDLLRQLSGAELANREDELADERASAASRLARVNQRLADIRSGRVQFRDEYRTETGPDGAFQIKTQDADLARSRAINELEAERVKLNREIGANLVEQRAAVRARNTSLERNVGYHKERLRAIVDVNRELTASEQQQAAFHRAEIQRSEQQLAARNRTTAPAASGGGSTRARGPSPETLARQEETARKRAADALRNVMQAVTQYDAASAAARSTLSSLASVEDELVSLQRDRAEGIRRGGDLARDAYDTRKKQLEEEEARLKALLELQNDIARQSRQRLQEESRTAVGLLADGGAADPRPLVDLSGMAGTEGGREAAEHFVRAYASRLAVAGEAGGAVHDALSALAASGELPETAAGADVAASNLAGAAETYARAEAAFIQALSDPETSGVDRARLQADADNAAARLEDARTIAETVKEALAGAESEAAQAVASDLGVLLSALEDADSQTDASRASAEAYGDALALLEDRLESVGDVTRQHADTLRDLRAQRDSGALSERQYSEAVEAATQRARETLRSLLDDAKKAGVFPDLVNALAEALDNLPDANTTTGQMVEDLQAAVGLADQISGAFDELGNTVLSRITRRVGDILDGVRGISQTQQGISSGDITGLAGTLGLAAGGVGVATAAFGLVSSISQSIAAQREHQREMRRLEDATRANTAALLSAGQRGEDVNAGGLRRGISDLQGFETVAGFHNTTVGNLLRNSEHQQRYFERALDRIEAAGLPVEDIRELLENGEYQQAFDELRRRLEQTAATIGTYSDDLAGSLEYLADRLRFTGDSAAEAFAVFLDRLQDTGAVDGDLLGIIEQLQALDFSREEDRQAARDLVAEVFNAIADPESDFDLGNLSPADVEAFLSELLRTLDAEGGTGEAGNVQSAASLTSVSAVQFDESLAVAHEALRSDRAREALQADILEAIRANGTASGAAPSGSTGTSTTNVFNVNVSVSKEKTADETAREVSRAVEDALRAPLVRRRLGS